MRQPIGLGIEPDQNNITSVGAARAAFDAGRKTYVDLMEAGIIDPTKVGALLWKNAVSVLLLTAAAMTEIPGPEAARPPQDMAI
jgi:chaperonin GroEL